MIAISFIFSLLHKQIAFTFYFIHCWLPLIHSTDIWSIEFSKYYAKTIASIKQKKCLRYIFQWHVYILYIVQCAQLFNFDDFQSGLSDFSSESCSFHGNEIPDLITKSNIIIFVRTTNFFSSIHNEQMRTHTTNYECTTLIGCSQHVFIALFLK